MARSLLVSTVMAALMGVLWFEGAPSWVTCAVGAGVGCLLQIVIGLEELRVAVLAQKPR